MIETKAIKGIENGEIRHKRSTSNVRHTRVKLCPVTEIDIVVELIRTC